MRLRERPRLRTLVPEARERHASWLELFFDLVFVVAVAKVAMILTEHTDAMGFARYAILFIPVWWSWIGFTFYADRFESDELTYRILTFVGMLAVTGVALTLGGAFSVEGDPAFVGCYVFLRLVIVTLYLRAAYYIPLARSFSLQYPLGLGVSCALLIGSLFIDPPQRYILWLLALIAELATPLINIRAARTLPIDLSHIPERFGLFTIIVLGEAVVATATGLSGVQWTLATILIGCFGFAMAAGIWWIIFDLVEDTALFSRSLLQRFSYIYGHYFAVASIVVVGIGVEHAIKESSEAHLHLPTLMLLCGGIATFMISITAVRLITGVCKLVFPRIAAIVLLLLLLYFGQFLSPVVATALVLLFLGAQIAIESYFAPEHEKEEITSQVVPCEHAGEIRVHEPRSKDGCEECRKNNYKWVHLRVCLTCGHVGCCDSSVNKHATKHFHSTGHPIMASLETGEGWAWCYIDDRYVPAGNSDEVSRVP